MAQSLILYSPLRLVLLILNVYWDTAPYDAFYRKEWNDRRDDNNGPPQDTKPVRGQGPEFIREVEQPGSPDARRKDDGNDEAAERHGEEAIGCVSRQPQAWKKAYQKDPCDESFVEPHLKGQEAPAHREAFREEIERDQPTNPVKTEIAGHDADIERRKCHADAGHTVSDQHAGSHGGNVLVNEGSDDDCEHQEPLIFHCRNRKPRKSSGGRMHESPYVFAADKIWSSEVSVHHHSTNCTSRPRQTVSLI